MVSHKLELIRWHVSTTSQWSIRLPLEGENVNKDSADRIIIPAHSNDFNAVSQDVVKSSDEVFLIKNLQVWSFKLVREGDKLYEWVSWFLRQLLFFNLITIRIHSNLFTGILSSDPLLGADKEFKKVNIPLLDIIKLLEMMND